MLIVTTENRDVYRNLALEEGLLDSGLSTPILFLYVNDPCVVIGKNQNPWRECRLSLMDQDDVALARRVSGGGAVYHDAGNLNVSVIVSRTEYVEEKQYDLLFKSLESFGINVEKMGRSSLAVDGLKFSGQAFCHRRDRTLHHGTLLVDTNLEQLGRYLGSDVEGIETKAVDSVPAQVTNLAEHSSQITIAALIRSLSDTFREMYGNAGHVECWSDEDLQELDVISIEERNRSAVWQLERTPSFSLEQNGQRLKVEKGRVVNLEHHPLFDTVRSRSI
jgi:lipoate---protein ligase